MAGLSITRLVVQAGDFRLGPLDLELADGETFVLLGPSGSGKTTLLEALAGFYRPRAGAIRLDGRDITPLPPERRRLGLVVQDYALFPHLTVDQNVAFGLRDRHQRRERVHAALKSLGIAHLSGRRPGGLSGGERQRVALARALVTEPAAFLLDEPLAALDAATRREVRDELVRFLAQIRATCLIVTHDQADAFALGHRLGLIAEGRLQQIGKPEWVYRRPVNAWVARFLGMQMLRPERVETDRGAATYRVAGVPLRAGADAPRSGKLLAFRPEDAALLPGASSCTNSLLGVIDAIQLEGPLLRVDLRLADGQSIATLAGRRALEQLGAERGRQVRCRIEPSDLWPVDAAPAGDGGAEPATDAVR